MTALDVFEPLGDLKPSTALTYQTMKPYWEQLEASREWSKQALPSCKDAYLELEPFELEWIEEVKKAGTAFKDMKWSDCPIHDIYRTEIVQPIFPARELTL